MKLSRRALLQGGMAVGVTAAIGPVAVAAPPAAPVFAPMRPIIAGIHKEGLIGRKLLDMVYQYPTSSAGTISCESILITSAADEPYEIVTMRVEKLEGEPVKYDTLYAALKDRVTTEPRVVTNICERLIAANNIARRTRVMVANLIIGNAKTLHTRFSDIREQHPKGKHAALNIFWSDESFPDDIVFLTMNNHGIGTCRSFVFEPVEDGVLFKATPSLQDRSFFLDVKNYQTIDEKVLISR